MTRYRAGRVVATILSVFAVLAAAWVLPPMIHRARHLCPVRPDGVRQASAMPNWARRYSVDCAVCHTTVPQLNRTGYQFRRNGFRMPDEVGQEAKFNNIGDMYAVRVREDYNATWGGTNRARNDFEFNELTFYPISGAFGKYWGSETEVTFNPDVPVEIENAYARFTYPVGKDTILTARAGIFHPIEGFGGSDRPISNFRPLFENTMASIAKNTGGNAAATFTQSNRLWGDDVQGAEFGATWKDTTLSLAVLNGYNTSLGAADSAKRSTSGSGAVRDDNNDRDYLVFFNQFIGDKGSFNAEWYHGSDQWQFDQSKPGSQTDSTFGNEIGIPLAANPTWTDRYDRGAFWGSYDALKNDKLRAMAGFEVGQDHFFNGNNFSDKFNNAGWFLEADSKLHEHLTGAARYDWFRPSTRTPHNLVTAGTLTAAIPFGNVKFMVDYQLKRTEKVAPTHDLITHTLQVEWMLHF